VLRTFDWPGNVRQLRGLVKSLALKSPIPLLDAPELREVLGRDEPSAKAPAPTSGAFVVNDTLSFDENVARLEKYLLEEALRGRSSPEAREHLQLKRSRFYEKMKQHALLK